MIDRATKLRWRRNVRRSKRQVEDIGFQAEEHLERHIIKRLGRLYHVKRFVLGWMVLLLLLIGVQVAQTRGLSDHYQKSVPAPGGVYTEGTLGAFTNANPVYAVGGVDGAVSSLIFSGLLKYDEQNKLVGDLAETWKIDKTQHKYAVVLRENLTWHDGQPLSAEDVVFTYDLIKNPDARSPLASSWQGVKVEATDERTVVFTLPNILSAFPHSMTNGIVPKHILENVDPGQLRSDLFNTLEPIGSGPFKWDVIEAVGGTPETREERIGLVPNESYHLGAPKVQRFVVRTFRSEEHMLESFRERELNAMSGLNSVPDTLEEERNLQEFSVPMTGQVMTFFNTSHPVLKDKKVRQALVHAVDRVEVLRGLGYPVIPSDSPFLRDHFAYDAKLTQLGTNRDRAEKLLDSAGWKRESRAGVRTKGDQSLTFRLYAQGTSDFTQVTQIIQRQWRSIGVDVEVIQPTDNDFQTAIAEHTYDALLYGVSLGTDPDVFAYWHSSQADIRSPNRLNLSEWENDKADVSLEGGRTRINKKLRKAKYEPFLKAWREDAPALALYQPRFLYVVGGSLHNFEPLEVNRASDRFNNVHNWMIRQTKVNL